jgi:hypothetical protein
MAKDRPTRINTPINAEHERDIALLSGSRKGTGASTPGSPDMVRVQVQISIQKKTEDYARDLGR